MLQLFLGQQVSTGPQDFPSTKHCIWHRTALGQLAATYSGPGFTCCIQFSDHLCVMKLCKEFLLCFTALLSRGSQVVKGIDEDCAVRIHQRITFC